MKRVRHNTHRWHHELRPSRLLSRMSGLLLRQPIALSKDRPCRSVLIALLNALIRLFWKHPVDANRLHEYHVWANRRLQYYFPHINLQALQWRDAIRLPIQLFRLLFFQFPSYYSSKHYQPLKLAAELRSEPTQAPAAKKTAIMV